MLATNMRRMRNNNLEIRVAGSSCRLACVAEAWQAFEKERKGGFGRESRSFRA